MNGEPQGDDDARGVDEDSGRIARQQAHAQRCRSAPCLASDNSGETLSEVRYASHPVFREISIDPRAPPRYFPKTTIGRLANRSESSAAPRRTRRIPRTAGRCRSASASRCNNVAGVKRPLPAILVQLPDGDVSNHARDRDVDARVLQRQSIVLRHSAARHERGANSETDDEPAGCESHAVGQQTTRLPSADRRQSE